MKHKYRVLACGLSLVFIAAVAGCARRPPALPQTSVRDSLRVAQDESFDPLDVSEDDLMKLPDSRLKSSASQNEGGTSKSPAGGAIREAAGFRVQLIATDSEVSARQIEQNALMDFQESVYLTFDPPNYKVRVGDCITRADANVLLGKAISQGYDNAWVVQCRVKVADR